MSNYENLKKVIPADQALANEALSRSLRQVKDIFNTDLPGLAAAVSVLETNKDLDLINNLSTPIPQYDENGLPIGAYWANTFASGTGPGNTITTNDIIGTAAGATHNVELPVVTDVLANLTNIGALDPLIGNGGTPLSVLNGMYTVMQYCLANAYPDGFGNIQLPTTNYFIPPTNPYIGYDDAFDNALIPATSNIIANIANTYSSMAVIANDATANMANQLAINVTTSSQAGIPIVAIDAANGVIGVANLESNSQSSIMGLTGQLHEIGLDIAQGGASQFMEAVANTSTLSGQAVIAGMREGRNIAVLNAVGITLDTQITDVNPNPVIANNLSNAQYTVSQATANIVL